MGLFRKELKQREALPFLLPVHVHSPHSPSDVKSLAHAPPRLKARLIGCTHTRTAHIAYTQRKRRGPYAVRPLSLRPPSAHSHSAASRPLAHSHSSDPHRFTHESRFERSPFFHRARFSAFSLLRPSSDSLGPARQRTSQDRHVQLTIRIPTGYGSSVTYREAESTFDAENAPNGHRFHRFHSPISL